MNSFFLNSLTKDYNRTKIRKLPALYTGLDAKLHSIIGLYKNSAWSIHTFLESAKEIDKQSLYWASLSDDKLQEKLFDFKNIFRRKKRGYEDALPEALGVIREAARRCLGLHPYVVQLAGALALYRGYLTEMATGEGKTLTAALTAVLNGWSGLPCHIITVNDYLATRDAKGLAQLYAFCGISVGYVTSEMTPDARRQGYSHDVTYTTSKEIVADFLRDRLYLGELQDTNRRQIAAILGRKNQIEKGLVMRGIHSAIVDEADSVLIDEAVTPLIISRSQPNEPFVDACKQANEIAQTLENGVHYTIDSKYNEVNFKSEYKNLGRHHELVKQALTAREFFKRDKQYILHGDKVVIVDEFTGRLMPQRTWQAGLHQLIEAKENMEITQPSETLARLSFQRFYRFFYKLSGMTGTAREAVPEFWHIYKIPFVRIPENKPCIRKIYPMAMFSDQESKWQAIVDEILVFHKQGRPILVGTRNIKISEMLAARLTNKGLAYRLLNARNYKQEADIVANAGQEGIITIATNMAGRGTDIKLGPKVSNLGGLHVIATECHESKRIDRQLFGRSARQGDPGSARSFVSMEDELICKYFPDIIRRTFNNTRTFFYGYSLRIRAEKKIKRERVGVQWSAKKTVEFAQRSAQRVAFRRRRSILRMDTWIDDSLSFAGGEM